LVKLRRLQEPKQWGLPLLMQVLQPQLQKLYLVLLATLQQEHLNTPLLPSMPRRQEV
jgi:hypothetical protein